MVGGGGGGGPLRSRLPLTTCVRLTVAPVVRCTPRSDRRIVHSLYVMPANVNGNTQGVFAGAFTPPGTVDVCSHIIGAWTVTTEVVEAIFSSVRLCSESHQAWRWRRGWRCRQVNTEIVSGVQRMLGAHANAVLVQVCS